MQFRNVIRQARLRCAWRRLPRCWIITAQLEERRSAEGALSGAEADRSCSAAAFAVDKRYAAALGQARAVVFAPSLPSGSEHPAVVPKSTMLSLLCGAG